MTGASSNAQRVDTLFAADGPLAEHLPGFAPRSTQTEMAHAVTSAIASDSSLVVEAGTGTGKTLAYLVPALLSGKRTIISTGTKALQDQLFDRDLPAARQALAAQIGGGLRVARLKGRSNYLCLYRFDDAQVAGRLAPALQGELAALKHWSAETSTGDRAENASVPEASPIWPMVTSTPDNCLGSKCPKYDDCWVVEARRRAQEADLVVVNHHLLFADLALKESGFGEVLPGADVVILDEAHQAPETAAQFFGVNITARQIRALVADGQKAVQDVGGDEPALHEELGQLDLATSALLRALPTGGRQSWDNALRATDDRLESLAGALDGVASHLAQVARRSDALEACADRAKGLCASLTQLMDPAAERADQVRWAERFHDGFGLRATPLSVADPMTAARERIPASWIFTSATLAVGTDFSHFQQRLGLEAADTRHFGSPFDYARNARLLLPDMPEPNHPAHREAVIDLAEDLIEASDGGAFVLCTSYAAVRDVAEALDARIDQQVLRQGEGPKNLLLEAFRLDGDAVLVGTQTFWEGVDVPGRALRLVIIDRLPFASPGDPVLQARSAAMKARGQNPFFEDQLPQAVVTLKQGAGRLIRGPSDTGVLVLCDPRLRSKPYGRRFLDSLPPMTRINDVAEACRFLRAQAT